MTTEPTLEEQAVFEARLRGGEARLVAGRTEDYEIAVNMGGITEVFDPLDITTDTGLLDAMELLMQSHPHEAEFSFDTANWQQYRVLFRDHYDETTGALLRGSRTGYWGDTLKDAIRAAWFSAVNADKDRHEE